MRVAAYLRVSSREQAEGYSLAAQERAVRDFCASKGWESPTLYVEPGVSAYTDVTEDRPAFAALLTAADQGACDVVVVHKLDRFARNLQVTLRELQRLDRAGVAFASISEAMDFSTPIGRVMLAMLAAFAQYFSDNLSAETRKGLDEKRAAGGHVGGVPYGARRTPEGHLVLDPDRADTLARILALVADVGATRTSALLNAESVPARNGPRWYPSSVRSLVLHADWLLDQPAPWPQRYAAARTRPRLPGVPTTAPVSLLTGLLRCACGGAVSYAGTNRQGVRYLECRQFGPARPTGNRCPYRKLRAEYYEQVVTEWVLGLPDLRGLRPAAPPDLAAARATLAHRRRLLGLALADGALTEADYRPRLAALAAEEAALPLASAQPEELAGQLWLLQQHWSALTVGEQRAALRGLVETVTIAGAAVTVVPCTALGTLLGAVQLSGGN